MTENDVNHAVGAVWRFTPEGLSLRDYFAAPALQGRLASMASSAAAEAFLNIAAKTHRGVAEVMASEAYEVADAMLAEREKSR